MLTAAISVMCVAVLLGMWLSSLHLLQEKPPPGIGKLGLIHGAAGALCVALLYLALQGPGRGVGHGAGGFGWTSFWMLLLALGGGLTILSFYLRGKHVSATLVALHATVGIGGAVMLAAYFSSPASFGR